MPLLLSISIEVFVTLCT